MRQSNFLPQIPIRPSRCHIVLVLLAVLCGCSSAYDDKSGFTYAVTKTAPEPRYNRVMAVRPPEVISASVSTANSKSFFPVMHFEVKGATLEEAARLLAQSVRYRSYCAASLAKQRITISTIGTVDEIGYRIQQQMRISVSVDHESKEVRFLTGI